MRCDSVELPPQCYTLMRREDIAASAQCLCWAALACADVRVDGERFVALEDYGQRCYQVPAALALAAALLGCAGCAFMSSADLSS